MGGRLSVDFDLPTLLFNNLYFDQKGAANDGCSQVNNIKIVILVVQPVLNCQIHRSVVSGEAAIVLFMLSFRMTDFRAAMLRPGGEATMLCSKQWPSQGTDTSVILKCTRYSSSRSNLKDK